MITVDPGSATHPTEQIRSQLGDQILSGELAGGQRIPSIRQLAADLRVAPGTVAKAYAQLESEGLLETSRGRGTHIVPGKGHPAGVRRAAEKYVAAVPDLTLEQALSAVRAAWPGA